MSSPRVRTNSFPSCTFGLYTAISVWPLGFNLSCSLTRQHMPETVSVRKVNGLPRASFSRNLAVQALPLAMCLAPPPALRDFHPVEFAHAERTQKGLWQLQPCQSRGGFRNFYEGFLFLLFLLFSLPSSDDFSHFLGVNQKCRIQKHIRFFLGHDSHLKNGIGNS